ncbi:MAG: hypothetical protein ACPLZY_04285, partial [Candidatus Norongarragalinales archaeon]
MTFVVSEETGGASLNVWIGRSLRSLKFDGNHPDFTIGSVNAKMVALAMLKRYPAKVFHGGGRRSARLMVVVKVRRSTCEALKLLSVAGRITAARAYVFINCFWGCFGVWG